MTYNIAVVSTKGGTGKTTTAANLGGIFSDLGMRVLLIDADVQPSLSKYYPLTHMAPKGLYQVITSGGMITPDCISHTNIRNLHLIYSNDPDSTLQTWLKDREDRLVLLKRALRSPVIQDNYDVVIIDTQGAIGELQKTAAMAADVMISPVMPATLSAREFVTGTIALMESLNRMADFSPELRSGDLVALINGMDNTVDARAIADFIRQEFRASAPSRVRVMRTQIPKSTVYPSATTAQVPVHQYDRPRQSIKRHTAYESMHQLVWELIPNLEGLFADEVTTEASLEDASAGDQE
jgi:chromosome partitioning related protein ParA